MILVKSTKTFLIDIYAQLLCNWARYLVLRDGELKCLKDLFRFLNKY